MLSQIVKTVADPCAAYESMLPLWVKSRAACSGERFVKALDGNFNRNLLIPFSPSMSEAQYNFYKSEAEFPGITPEFLKMIVGGLLRKPPVLTFKKNISEEIVAWIRDSFCRDDSTLIAFLDDALFEEIQTSRAWVYVSYPFVENSEDLTKKQREALKPYPILLKAENVINWRIRDTGNGILLDQLIVRGLEPSYEKNQFHPEMLDVVYVHMLDDNGFYIIKKFMQHAPQEKPANYISGKEFSAQTVDGLIFEEVEVIENLYFNGERLSIIPVWPLNGSIELREPILMPIIDKEIALYNKISRRNHLLYGAATYTPFISSDMSEERFESIVSSGLGTWLRLNQGDTADILKTPTEALDNMEKAIVNGYEDIAKLGVRMLSPETEQSGIALQLRNASQTAKLGSLNARISGIMKQVILFMINWRYDLGLTVDDLDFSLSQDFAPTQVGEGWLRLATEWYEGGKIPRSTWLQILKSNDILPPEYNDELGREEINNDALLIPKVDEDYTNKIVKK